MHPRFRCLLALLLLAADRAAAQRVRLEIRPNDGDTLRMRLDQESEMTGVRRTEAGESSAMVYSTMRMFSRAIVEGATHEGTKVLAVTDSVLLSTSDDRSRAAAQQLEAQMRGQRVRFRVGPDGSVTMLQADDGATRDVAQVVSLMPATFPKDPVAVGESWMREMPLPASTQLGAQLSGRLHVTFRLDSIVHHGERAYVSMRGDVKPATGPGASGALLEQGTVNGTMVIDQKRRWLSESWFNVLIMSTVSPTSSSGGHPMRMQMRITQHMHTFDRR
ncbi:MAG TPA: hypothetical protein VN651_12550 [Gemmatimonadaceae bacterium]|nr:hypothetical protein [Gemmatimonadaceae bacterium]